ncbi:MAG: PKD domain-containing protein, partial [Flavobacteriales bacterium]
SSCDYDIEIDVSNCSSASGSGGIQWVIADMDPVDSSFTNFHEQNGGESLEGTFNFTISATQDVPVVIAVDGYGGDECDVSVTVTPSGCGSCNIVSCAADASFTTNDTAQCINAQSFDFTNTGSTGSGWSFEWDFESDGIVDATTENVSGHTYSSPGTYTVSHVVDSSGCRDSLTQEIIVHDTASLSSTVTDVSCNGACDGSINLSVTGNSPYDYDWDNDGTGDFDDSQDLSSLCPGTYTVSVRDANGCINTLSATVTEPNVLSVSAQTDADETCAGDCDGEVSVSSTSGGTSPYSYDWADMSGNNVGSGTSVTGLCDGDYEVTVTDANGCTAKDTTTILPGVNITADIASVANQCYSGNSFTFDGTGSSISSGSISSYSWDFGDGNTGSGSTVTHSYSSSGTY